MYSGGTIAESFGKLLGFGLGKVDQKFETKDITSTKRYVGQEVAALLLKLNNATEPKDVIITDFLNHKFDGFQVPTLDNKSFWDSVVLDANKEDLTSAAESTEALNASARKDAANYIVEKMVFLAENNMKEMVTDLSSHH